MGIRVVPVMGMDCFVLSGSSEGEQTTVMGAEFTSLLAQARFTYDTGSGWATLCLGCSVLCLGLKKTARRTRKSMRRT